MHLGQPQGTALQKSDQDLHADMAALAHDVGNRQQRKAHHADFDDVDIAVDRVAPHGAQDDLDHAEQHQPEDHRPGGEVEKFLYRRKQPVGQRQSPAQSITNRSISHPLLPSAGSLRAGHGK
jgi:hypothetical protein